jgi:hypothetical protein
MGWVDILGSVVETLRHSAFWVKVVAATCVLVLVALALGLLLLPGDKPNNSPRASWGRTSDPIIDGVHAELNIGKWQTEAELIGVIRPLFARPGFHSITAEPPAEVLFALYRTELVVEYYLSEFRTIPFVKGRLVQLVVLLIELQEHIATLYGPAFQRGVYCERNPDRVRFIEQMPPPVRDPRSPEFVNPSIEKLMNLDKALRDLGLR